ncbi:flagellar hook-length control protein FliK [Janthinobacterium sp. FW305-128]|uniref:flagellar hook-length control protein FliK n=1 Tax=Janthinobacterium sp. FW305-128 TaxID=2775055 RepID=UPI001E4CB007|nr:flagellar hook-length control protein FliK [Janthinobacterium sp. FW305-128]MCC7682571.1 flagellar hook-length control protein FliK [Janthinobacterium sp. FW305-128]
MIMNFNTAPAAPAPASPAAAAPAPAAAPSQAAALPGTPGYAATGAVPSALPLFAQVLDVTGVETADADTPAPAKESDSDSQADSSLPAMAAPVIGLPVTMLPPTDAAAAEARAAAQAQVQTQAQTQVQANAAQANPALNISLHPSAVTLNAPATAPAPGRDTREPLAAANPATAAKGGAPAQPFESLLQQSAPATAVAAPAVAAREGERGAATPAPATPNLGLTGAVGNTATAAPAGDTIKLNGPAQQWQEPLREALGERLQTQIGRNSEHATIRLEPPMLGRIEISIRHTAGALQVNVTASNSEVLRQLQGIGENMRSDLAQRQYTDVAVNISATPRSPAAHAFAEGDARGQRQPGRQQDDAEPGRALSDGSTAATTYASHERETA